METLIVVLIGLVAAGYVGRRVWRGLAGKDSCNCGGACSGGGCPASRECAKK
jgi:hypothetical protein